MSELRPCPFCGGEAEYVSQHAKGKRWGVACTMTCKTAADDGAPMCRCRTPFFKDKGQARDVWNRRAERTCKAELMPKNRELRMTSWLACSECGAELSAYGTDKYCQGCGAKVVS